MGSPGAVPFFACCYNHDHGHPHHFYARMHYTYIYLLCLHKKKRHNTHSSTHVSGTHVRSTVVAAAAALPLHHAHQHRHTWNPLCAQRQKRLQPSFFMTWAVLYIRHKLTVVTPVCSRATIDSHKYAFMVRSTERDRRLISVVSGSVLLSVSIIRSALRMGVLLRCGVLFFVDFSRGYTRYCIQCSEYNSLFLHIRQPHVHFLSDACKCC